MTTDPTAHRPDPQFLQDAQSFAQNQLGPRMLELLSDEVVLKAVKASVDESADIEDGILRWVHRTMSEDLELENEFVGYFWGQLYQRGRRTMASDSPLRRLLDTADLAHTVYRRIGPRLAQFDFRSRRQFMRLLVLNMENRTKDKARQLNAAKRGEKLKSTKPVEDIDSGELGASESSDPVIAAIRSEQGRLVFLICSRLSENDRAVIKGLLEGKSTLQMAEEKGKTEAAVRVALQRALTRARHLAERYQ